VIHYLQGKILFKEPHFITLGVGSIEHGVVGYAVHCSEITSTRVSLGSQATFYIYTHVREDLLELFGFLSQDEKKLFLLLIGVNGIGPKGALTVLSALEPSILIHCILQRKKDELVKCPGIGKKTAERIVLELSDLLAKKIEKGEFSSLHESKNKLTGSLPEDLSLSDSRTALIIEARQALIGLGFKEGESERLLSLALQSNKLLETKNLKVESLIKSALQQRQRSS